ncbi:DUF397 domain-containing protein [Streptomyces sp. NPDC051561]|uniref:DUF397 domain-containing protein n=1 Tax=Streptomyces sp. NPDC051561 TaxID=3365658 RepID=UPI0037B14A88
MNEQLHYRKSSYSGQNGGDCVEVAQGSTEIHVRDSKNVERAGMSVGPSAWTDFLNYATTQQPR